MRSIFAGCVGLFLRISEEKKIKVSLRKCLKVVGMKVLEGDKRAVPVTSVGTELRNRGRLGCLYTYFCSH